VQAAAPAADVPYAALPSSAYAVKDVEDDARTVMPDAIVQAPPPAARAPREPSSYQWRYIGLAAAGAFLAIAAAVLALSLGGSGGDGNSGTLSNDDIRLQLPGGWKQTDVSRVPGLAGEKSIAGARGAEAFVAAQLVPGDADPSLLPADLRDALQRRSPDPATIQLAKADAYRYDDIAVSGLEQRLTIFAAPTTAGVATVVCGVARDAARSAGRQCAEIARTLTLVSAERLSIGTDGRYDETLGDTFNALDRGLDAAGTRLARPGSAKDKAAAVGKLAGAYRAAAAALKPAQPLPPVESGLTAQLTSAFTRASSAYGELRQAVLSSDRRAMSSARALLRRLGSRVRRANATLERAGYSQSAAVPRQLSAKELRGQRAPSSQPAPAPAVAPQPPSGATPPPRSIPPPSAPRRSPPPAARPPRPPSGGGGGGGGGG
jgi:hypothetical protein